VKFLTSIRTKVWMTVLVVFAGYLVSTLSSFSLNAKLSEHLTHLRGYDFFLAMKSTKAQSAFKEQAALYEDAYLTGNRESAQKGNAMTADILAILDEMIETVNSCSHRGHTTPFMGLFIRHNAGRLLDLRQRYRDFSSEAATIYLRASRNEDTPELRQAIRRLGETKGALHRDFAETEVLYVSSFERGIDRMKAAASRETYFLLSLFVAVLVAAAAITNFVATRLLVKPLRRVHDMVASFAKGSIEPPSLIPSDRKDEIGELEGAFYQMTVDLKSTTVSKHYVDNVIKSMTDSLVVVTTKGTVKTVNETTLDLLGYTAGEITGRPFSMIFEESDDEAVVFRTSGVRTLLRKALIRNIEKRYRTRDGRTIPVLVSLAAMTAEDGSFQGLVCVARDITERKRAEEALRQSERDLKNIMNSVHAGIIVIDPSDHVIVDANDYALTMLGLAKDAVVGRSCRSLICPSLEDACPISDLNAPAESAERLLVTSTGGSIPILKSAVPVVYRGRPHFIESFIDISPLKQAESKLQALAAKLGQSNEELKEINEELKNFAYIVSHDLRAPLVNIKGFSVELGSAVGEIKSFLSTSLPHARPEERARIETIIGEDVQEALNFISSSITRMDALISAILNLSRLGRRALSPEPVDMTGLVHGILKTLAHQLEERSARVTVGTLPAMEADKTALGMIFGNLLDNAVKYLDRTRPGEIDVSAERRNGEFLFRIRDNGRGIAESDVHKVFDLFCRAAHNPDVPGEGMGLAYVRTLVRRHGGRIWCESKLGEGTTFCFTLSTPRV
jgi:PAS domain S-box-containing protein